MKRIIIVLILVAGVTFQVYSQVDADKSDKSLATISMPSAPKEISLDVVDDTSEEVPMRKSNMTPKRRAAVEVEEDVFYEEPTGPVGRAVDATEDVAVAAGDTLEAAAEVPGRVLGVL